MRYSVLSGEEEKRIHEAALCILEEVGLDVALPSLVAKLRERGFRHRLRYRNIESGLR